MLFNIPNGNLKDCYNSLCNWLDHNKPEHLHKSLPAHNMKYLGHYVGIQGTELEPEAFQAYDLYVYNGSKFNPITFIAKFGEREQDYTSSCIEDLAEIKNRDLKKFAVGEAYRRYKKRQPCKGCFG